MVECACVAAAEVANVHESGLQLSTTSPSLGMLFLGSSTPHSLPNNAHVEGKCGASCPSPRKLLHVNTVEGFFPRYCMRARACEKLIPHHLRRHTYEARPNLLRTRGVCHDLVLVDAEHQVQHMHQACPVVLTNAPPEISRRNDRTRRSLPGSCSLS